jgi:hypothetical protein
MLRWQTKGPWKDEKRVKNGWIYSKKKTDGSEMEEKEKACPCLAAPTFKALSYHEHLKPK